MFHFGDKCLAVKNGRRNGRVAALRRSTFASTPIIKNREKVSSPSLKAFQANLLRPGRPNRLADQQCRVGALPRHELLWAAAPYLRRVKVAVLIHAKLVRSPQSSWLRRHRAPRIQQLPCQVVFVELEIPVTVRHP